eukprot:1190126-Prorocentrum_minimum.AAC.12
MHVTVDSEKGLIAYMNVFMRCNELVRVYQMTRVSSLHHQRLSTQEAVVRTYGYNYEAERRLAVDQLIAPPSPWTPRVTENWNVKPGDGSIYFTLRPAWVAKRTDEDNFVAPPPHISEFVTRAREARAEEEADDFRPIRM